MNRRLALCALWVGVLALVAGCGSQRSAATVSSVAPATAAQQFSPQTQQQFQQIVSAAMQQYNLPGMVVAISVPGKGSWMQASGVASTAGNHPMATADHFKIGSVTKTFTATVILQLVDQGKLSLTAPISQWVPNVPNASKITVEQLLNMTSGIYNEGGPGSALANQVRANPSRVWTPQQIVALAVSQQAASAPGQYSYSDTNYQILAIIAQAVTGQPIQNLIASQILAPLHLANTSYPTTTAVPAAATTGYFVSGTQRVAAPQPDPSALGAAGAMISTAGDLQTWAAALANGTLLKPATQLHRLQTVPTGISFSPLAGVGQSAPLSASYGLGIINAAGFLGHNGLVNGYQSAMYYLPSKQASIVVLSNGQSVTGSETTADAVFASLAGVVNQLP